MVAQLAAVGGEEIQPLVQGFLQVCKATDLHARGLLQLGQVIRPGGLFQVHGFVGPPGRQHCRPEGIVCSQFFMPLQTVRRVVGGTDSLHVAAADQSPHREAFFTEFLIAQVPYCLRCIFAEDALISEVPAQFQVAPVIQRIPDGFSKDCCPRQKLLIIGGISGNISLCNTRCTHQTPFVVVAPKPNLGDIVIPAVLPDLSGIYMTVIVDDRAFRSRPMVQLFCGLCVQQEILIEKHCRPSFSSSNCAPVFRITHPILLPNVVT